MAVIERIQHAWDVFWGRDPERYTSFTDYGAGSGWSYHPSRTRLTVGSERTLVASIYTQLSIDVAEVVIRHIKVDENGRYSEPVVSGLGYCLTQEANIDQGGRQFRQDVALTLFEKGVVAIVPTKTSISPLSTGGYDIKELRVGEILQWFPQHVEVRVYNDKTGLKEDLVLPKTMVAIVENPLYNIMNEPNSILQRLIRKLSMLDAIDEQTSSGKLDLLIQLPYVIKSQARREQAETRRKDIEVQLKGSQYGIAYIDGTERVTQLNRPAENNLLSQIQYLTDMLFNQLGLTKAIFDGTADERTMLNYYNRTIQPIVDAVVEAMSRTFLTKTARTQGQRLNSFRDPFKLVTMEAIAMIADRFTRNEILSSNEVRALVGFQPSNDPKAEELRNKNLPLPDTEGDSQNGSGLQRLRDEE